MKNEKYCFDFTTEDIQTMKMALRYAGVEFTNIRKLYKRFCESVCDNDDKQILARYE